MSKRNLDLSDEHEDSVKKPRMGLSRDGRLQDVDDSDYYETDDNTDKEDDTRTCKMDMIEFRKEFIEDTGKDDTLDENTAGISLPKQNNVVSFDVKDEMENGFFDKDGNYIENKDNTSQSEDEFTTSMDLDEIEKNQLKQLNNYKKLRLRKRKLQLQKRQLLTNDALLRLYYLIPTDLTVLETLASFNNLRAKETKEFKFLISNGIDYLTELVDILQQKNIDSIDDIYNWTRQDISQLLKDESLEPDFRIDNYNSKNWSFKWFKKMDKLQEPYSNHEMQYWKDTYFNGKVTCKLTDDDDVDKNWLHIDCLQFI